MLDEPGRGRTRPWRQRRRTWLRIGRGVLSFAVAFALIAWLLPRVAGATWAQIVQPFGHLPAGLLVLCAGLQLFALWLFTFTITGALPGISHGRALTVNLAGSFVANTVPFGGAIGVGVTYGMCRSWGFRSPAIAISVVLGGIWTGAAKIVLPLIGMIALTSAGGAVTGTVRDAVLAASVLLAAVLLVFVVLIISPRAAQTVAGLAARTVQGVRRRLGRPLELHWDTAAARLHEQTRDVMRTGWARMSFGTLGYYGVYFGLFWLCLSATGVTVGLAVVLATFALGRLLTSLAVTPGGIGLVEAGTVAMLVALGANPAASAAATLLFTVFTHLLEIPFGAIAWAWYLSHRGGGSAGTPAADNPPRITEHAPLAGIDSGVADPG